MPHEYHSGEILVQTLAGESLSAERNGRMIAERIPPAAREFLRQQRFCVIARRAREGEVWAGVLAGAASFADSDETLRRLTLALDDPGNVLSGSPPFDAMSVGDQLGMLFIDLATRRRLRIEGRVATFTSRSLSLAIDYAYPNCPKYIQKRQVHDGEESSPAARQATMTGTALTPELRAWIQTADTFFVASCHPDGAADASHRGGAPGFVRIVGDTLDIPDYTGNSMFKTLGNIALYPAVGLTFIDFDNARQLQLTGLAALDLERGDRDGVSGTGRWWTFKPTRWIVSALNLPLRWSAPEPSPFNL